jgi:hypothetical protein
VAGNALLIKQLPQQLSDRSADRVDRTGVAAKPPDNPRDIDSAPPGSRRCDWPRSLATGTILSTTVERSTAGFGVIVTISVMCWFELRTIRVVDPNVLAIPGKTRTSGLRFRKPFSIR